MLLMARGDPGVDERFEEAIGVNTAFTAIGIGGGTTHIIAFSLKGAPLEEDVLFSLSLVRRHPIMSMAAAHPALPSDRPPSSLRDGAGSRPELPVTSLERAHPFLSLDGPPPVTPSCE
jgi:hypothetical protein